MRRSRLAFIVLALISIIIIRCTVWICLIRIRYLDNVRIVIYCTTSVHGSRDHQGRTAAITQRAYIPVDHTAKFTRRALAAIIVIHIRIA